MKDFLGHLNIYTKFLTTGLNAVIKQFQSADKLRKCCCLAAAKSHKAIANPSVFDHLGPFWAHLNTFGPFQKKMNCLPQMDKVGFGGGAPEQKIDCMSSIHM